MVENIWYIIISETNEAIDFLCKGQKDKIIVEDILQQIFLAMDYNPDTGECQMSDPVESLCSALKKPMPSAKNLTERICEVLQYYYRFGNHSGNYMVTALDSRLNWGKTPAPRLLDQLALDILLPNLYSVLLLEAKGYEVPEADAINLKTLLNEYPGDPSRFYHILGDSFPNELKHLFALKDKTGPKPYRICTQHPQLFLAILSCLKSSPLCGKSVTEHSLASNEYFFNECMNAIAPKGNWTGNSFSEYYLFERFFRLNTKLTLFWGENRDRFQPGNIQAPDKFLQRKSISCPGLLADVFFSSPLVLFPSDTFVDFIFNDEPAETDAELIESQFLSFIINLSSCWFPIALILFRLYFLMHHIKGYDAVYDFLFPNQGEFAAFAKKYTPEIKIKSDTPGRIDSRDVSQALKNRYAKTWSVFKFDNVNALNIQTRSHWLDKAPPNYYTTKDRSMLRHMREWIYY